MSAAQLTPVPVPDASASLRARASNPRAFCQQNGTSVWLGCRLSDGLIVFKIAGEPRRRL